jgi:hypothetical protein
MSPVFVNPSPRNGRAAPPGFSLRRTPAAPESGSTQTPQMPRRAARIPDFRPRFWQAKPSKRGRGVERLSNPFTVRQNRGRLATTGPLALSFPLLAPND